MEKPLLSLLQRLPLRVLPQKLPVSFMVMLVDGKVQADIGPNVVLVADARPVRRATRAESPDRERGVMLQRSIMIAALMLLATPAAAEWTLPCIFGGCSITFVFPEYSREAGAAARSGSCVGANQRLPDEEWAEAGCPR